MNVQKLYDIRFQPESKARKVGIWKEICSYLKRFIISDKNYTIVDVAAGKKYAIDINPDVKKYAKDDVKVIVDDIQNLSLYLEKDSVTIFFMSNFLEHISKAEISNLLNFEYNLLEPGGEVWILTPNIKYVGDKYWDFFDHITPITEKAIIEEAQVIGYGLKKCIKKFLPYTTKSALPTSHWIVKLYLKLMPLSGMFFGEQSFLILKK